MNRQASMAARTSGAAASWPAAGRRNPYEDAELDPAQVNSFTCQKSFKVRLATAGRPEHGLRLPSAAAPEVQQGLLHICGHHGGIFCAVGVSCWGGGSRSHHQQTAC